MIMGKGIITYQKRLELIDECLRNYERPMTVKEICDECNHKLGVQYTDRTYRNDLEKIEFELGGKINRDQKRDGCQCLVYQNVGFSIKGDTVANQVVICNLDKIKKALGDFLGLGLESSLTTMTDEINKFMGYDDNNRPVISFEKVLLESHGRVKPHDLLELLLKAIIQHQTMDIRYEVPGRGKREWTVFPQFLKQYNQRWYLIATKHRDEVEGKIYNLLWTEFSRWRLTSIFIIRNVTLIFLFTLKMWWV